MDADDLKNLQAPLKARYNDDPATALITLRAEGRLDGDALACSVETGKALVEAGLHPATGATAPRRAPATCCSRPWSPAPA